MTVPRLDICRDPAAWEQAFARLHAPSQMARYGCVAAGAMLEPGAEAEAAIVERDGEILFHPYLRRPIPGETAFDLISAYEFGGFWFSTPDPARRRTLMADFDRLFPECARRNTYVASFQRLHPFTDAAGLGMAAYQLNKHCDNVVVPLGQPMERIRDGYRYAKKKQVRQGRDSGLVIRESRDFALFNEVMYANLGRLNALPYYYFPKAFLEAVSGHLELVFVYDPAGEVCGAHLYFLDGPHVFAYLCHGIQAKTALRPNDFCYDAMIERFNARGYQAFHFGGGAESLYRYKSQFSPATVPYYVAKAVFDPESYGALVEKRLAKGAVPQGFFPLYRAPGG